MVTQLEVWNLVVLQLWEDRRQWDNRMPFGQFVQSHRSLRFTLCLRGWHKEPPYQRDPTWALSFTWGPWATQGCRTVWCMMGVWGYAVLAFRGARSYRSATRAVNHVCTVAPIKSLDTKSRWSSPAGPTSSTLPHTFTRRVVLPATPLGGDYCGFHSRKLPGLCPVLLFFGLILIGVFSL